MCVYSRFMIADLSIQKLCLLYLARMQNSMYCGLRDDYIVKKLINQYELILPILHVVVCNMSLPNIEFLLQHVMAESDETVHIEFCKSLKLLICSLSKRCYFTRYYYFKIFFIPLIDREVIAEKIFFKACTLIKLVAYYCVRDR